MNLKKKRKIHIVAKQFQFMFMAVLTLWSVFTVAILYILENFLINSFIPFVPNNTEGKMMLKTITQNSEIIIIAVGIGLFIMDFILVIYSAQKIAGPLSRFYKHMLDDSEDGKLSHIYFRKGDYFPQLAEAYNKLTEKIVENVDTI